MSYFRPKSRNNSQPAVLGKCNRSDVANTIKPHYTQLIGRSTPGAFPIVYSDVYNIGFLGVRHEKRMSKALSLRVLLPICCCHHARFQV